MSGSKKLVKWYGVPMSLNALLVFGREHLFNLSYCKNDVHIDMIFPYTFVMDKFWDKPEK
jgi:hypothetical protein